jgi:hypothetical protein
LRPSAPPPAAVRPLCGLDCWFLVVTWGAIKSMSWQFYNAYADESYTIISTDFLTGKKKAPSGFDMAQLTKDLSEIAHVPSTRAAFGTKKF